eukprot:GHVP01068561.1.p1 GENE.GHVP01068561.1~~GHVP01068561.1.p1  ORF type:complete len:701 (+),score=149.71 GHVP01068561.1:281-2104(+)
MAEKQGDEDSVGFRDPYLGLEKVAVNYNLAAKEAQKAMEFQRVEAAKKAKFLREIQRQKEENPLLVKIHRYIEDIDPMQDIILHDILLEIADKILLTEASLTIVKGKKYGLVGRNGIGKSTLMNAFVRGSIKGWPRSLHVGCVEQENCLSSDVTPMEAMLALDTERTELIDLLKSLKNSEGQEEQISKVEDRLVEIESDLAEDKAKAILMGLGFTEFMIDKPIKNLSGGWKMRLLLSRCLYAAPDVICLDEPTNHLDIHAVCWLSKYIASISNTCIIVSHSRDFLNDVCDSIVEMRAKKLEVYSGNYDTFEKNKSMKMKTQMKQYDTQMKKREHIQSFVDRFRANAKRAALVQSRIKALNKMPLLDEILEDPTQQFDFFKEDQAPNQGISVSNASFYYEKGNWILKNIDLRVDGDTRIALCGLNGSGKSTLLKLLVGEIDPVEGSVEGRRSSRVAYFAQHHIDRLDVTLTPVEQLQAFFPEDQITDESGRNWLGRFGITGPLAMERQYILSGGQKSRVAFALMAWRKPQVLVLDEPTNHLDLDAIQALIVALNEFKGGVIVVSHDSHFISACVETIYEVKDKHLHRFEGDIWEFKTATLKDIRLKYT